MGQYTTRGIKCEKSMTIKREQWEILQMFSLRCGKNLNIDNMCKDCQMSLTLDSTNTGKLSQFL
jgi:hypothetical protein